MYAPYISTCVNTYIEIFTYMYVYVYMHSHRYVCMYIYIYIYLYMYIECLPHASTLSWRWLGAKRNHSLTPLGARCCPDPVNGIPKRGTSFNINISHSRDTTFQELCSTTTIQVLWLWGRVLWVIQSGSSIWFHESVSNVATQNRLRK